jgi:hypothetical protein
VLELDFEMPNILFPLDGISTKKRGLYWELIRQQEIEEEIEEMRGHFF